MKKTSLLLLSLIGVAALSGCNSEKEEAKPVLATDEDFPSMAIKYISEAETKDVIKGTIKTLEEKAKKAKIKISDYDFTDKETGFGFDESVEYTLFDNDVAIASFNANENEYGHGMTFSSAAKGSEYVFEDRGMQFSKRYLNYAGSDVWSYSAENGESVTKNVLNELECVDYLENYNFQIAGKTSDDTYAFISLDQDEYVTDTLKVNGEYYDAIKKSKHYDLCEIRKDGSDYYVTKHVGWSIEKKNYDDNDFPQDEYISRKATLEETVEYGNRSKYDKENELKQNFPETFNVNSRLVLNNYSSPQKDEDGNITGTGAKSSTRYESAEKLSSVDQKNPEYTCFAEIDGYSQTGGTTANLMELSLAISFETAKYDDENKLWSITSHIDELPYDLSNIELPEGMDVITIGDNKYIKNEGSAPSFSAEFAFTLAEGETDYEAKLLSSSLKAEKTASSPFIIL